MLDLRKEKKSYKVIITSGDTVLAPCAKDVYRKATVISTQERNDNVALRIRFDTGNVHFISAELCYRVVNGIVIPLEKPKTKKQKFCVWLLRKFGLIEV